MLSIRSGFRRIPFGGYRRVYLVIVSCRTAWVYLRRTSSFFSVREQSRKLGII